MNRVVAGAFILPQRKQKGSQRCLFAVSDS
jgi:hypothetical protein